MRAAAGWENVLVAVAVEVVAAGKSCVAVADPAPLLGGILFLKSQLSSDFV